MILNPKNPPSLDNGCWNFGGKDARQRPFKKAANFVLEKTIHKKFKNPATNNSNKLEYPRNVIGILRKMIETTWLDSVQNSAFNYMRIIADHGLFACCCREWTLIKIQRTHVSP